MQIFQTLFLASFLGLITVTNCLTCLSEREGHRFSDLDRSELHLSCGSNPDSVIFDIDIIAGNGDGQHAQTACHGGCEGLPPSLIVEKLKCIWHNNCTIHFPHGPMLQLLGDSDAGCVGDTVEFLGAEKPRCFEISEEKAFVRDFCDATNQVISKSSGLLVSHPGYPWMYTPKENRCQKTISFIASGPEYLLIRAPVVDIDTDANETLTIYWTNDDGQSLTAEKRTIAIDRTYTGVKIVWSRMVDYPNNGGEGFIICYLFSEDRNLDPCDALLTDTNSSVDKVFAATTTRVQTTSTTTAKPKQECSCKKGRKKKCRKKNGKRGRKCRKKEKRKKGSKQKRSHKEKNLKRAHKIK